MPSSLRVLYLTSSLSNFLVISPSFRLVAGSLPPRSFSDALPARFLTKVGWRWWVFPRALLVRRKTDCGTASSSSSSSSGSSDWSISIATCVSGMIFSCWRGSTDVWRMLPFGFCAAGLPWRLVCRMAVGVYSNSPSFSITLGCWTEASSTTLICSKAFFFDCFSAFFAGAFRFVGGLDSTNSSMVMSPFPSPTNSSTSSVSSAC